MNCEFMTPKKVNEPNFMNVHEHEIKQVHNK